AVLKLSDMMVLCMAFPNVLGLYLLSGKVRKALNEYWMLHRAP
ncbi:MAG: AGCS family alanine or glycine:cation symporter, partial [Gammaproteobacteria bacterium]